MSKLRIDVRMITLCGILGLLLGSCASRKDIVYFQDAKDFETIVSDNTQNNSFKVNDVIGINVSTLDPTASIPFNLMNNARQEGSFAQPQQLDYIVDKNGEIDFPVLGAVKVLGLNPQETKELLKEKLKPYLKNPIINIRLRNFRVSVLGQVNRPGTYEVNGEQITVLEAIGMAGDIGIKGRRDNVLIVRDFNGTKVYTRVDLTSTDVLTSNSYYLTQNDVVYVEPNKSAVTQSTIDARTGYAISIASVLITSTILFITRN